MRNVSVLFGILLWTLCASCKGLRDPCEGLEDGTRLPHRLQCDRFVICKGQRVSSVSRCPRGLHFNSRLSVCDLKQRARCDAVVVLPSPSMRSEATECSSGCCSCCNCCNCAPLPSTCHDVPTFPDTPSPPDTCPTPGEATTPSGPSTGPSDISCNNKGVCENQPDGTMFPDPGSNGYLVCQNKCEIPMPCPRNLIFNPVLNVCDWPKHTPGPSNMSTTESSSTPSDPSPSDSPSTPTDSSTPDPSTTPNATSSTESSSTLSDPSPSDSPSTPRDSSTPDPSTTPNATSSTESSSTLSDPSPSDSPSTPRASSTTYTSATTISTPSSPSDPATGPSGTTCNSQGVCESQSDGAMFPDPGSNGYIVCQCECEVAMPCPSGLIFNPVLKVCDWPNTVKPTPIIPSTGNPTPNGSSATVCNNKGKCEGQRDGTMFADPNTSGYVVCLGECEVPRPCPVGLVFNPKVNVCDWPQAFV